ncbi:MAG: hypothetical protein ETSY2_23135 [Candidatus Entotheonella gemina]|uniref:Uncharacterized protein n=1 Tax=Candidatus Entotheonella gemina TaxID=1429439 RepID=W4M704_9BACT|nr:MAG: hypothetical protein ETSY2_23135 [Candidatus Entotheonella gemina]
MSYVFKWFGGHQGWLWAMIARPTSTRTRQAPFITEPDFINGEQ